MFLLGGRCALESTARARFRGLRALEITARAHFRGLRALEITARAHFRGLRALEITARACVFQFGDTALLRTVLCTTSQAP